MNDTVKNQTPDATTQQPVVAEVKTTPQTTQQTKAPAATVVEQKKPPVTRTLSDKVQDVLTNGSGVAKNAILAIQSYAEKMAPGVPMDAVNGVVHQHTLWMALSNFINSSENVEFSIVIDVIESMILDSIKNSGVFTERYVFRFTQAWPYAEEELNRFHNTLSFLIAITFIFPCIYKHVRISFP